MAYTLKSVQKHALAAAAQRPGFGYFLEMGLGKTLVALHEFSQLAHAKRATRMVVVAPNTFKAGWQREIETHGFDYEFHIYRASAHAAAEKFVARGERDANGNLPTQPFAAPAVLIVNYDIFYKQKFQQLLARFTNRRNVMLVADESIMLKNPQAKRTKAVVRSVREGRFSYVRLLSGRPQTQGPHDLCEQLRIIGGHTMNFYQFRGTFCRMGGYENRVVIGAQNEPMLRRMIANCAIVAKKQDWLPDLPEKSYTVRDYQLKGAAAVEYARMEDQYIAFLRGKEGGMTAVEAQIALAKYTKLLQVHAGFIHDNDGTPSWLVEDGDNARLQTLLEVLDEEVEGKCCIVYKHQFVGEKLMQIFADRFNHPAIIKGGMKPADVQSNVDAFNRDKTVRLCLLQVDAAKYGLTLLGDQAHGEHACRTMIFFENSYSFETRGQVEDRIHRIGQRNPALYVDLVGSTMDGRMIAALQKKQKLYEALFGR